MANLKDIGYGIGKYLVASDASALPGIENNRKNLDLLNFKVAVNNAYSLYNFKDGMIDGYQTEDGVDTATSTNEVYDSSGKYYQGFSSTQTAFTTTGNTTWTSPAGVTSTTVLVVGGGGGSSKGGWTPGGSGAGGLVYIADYTVAASQLYNLTIGAGGVGGGQPANPGYVIGQNGGNSVFDVSGTSQTLTANGGGYGGWYNGTHTVGTGGSGGGGSVAGLVGATNQPVSFGSYTNVGFGFAGGAGNSGGTNRPSGGGGGAGSVGQAQQGSSQSGNGGAGKDYSSVFGTGVGDDGWFAGGSGGGGTGGANFGYPNGGNGLKGGGGTSGRYYGTPGGTNGMANTGGGGGAESNDTNGHDGGSGVIILKYMAPGANMTLLSNAQTAQAAPTEGRLMIYEETSTGSTTLDTDLKGYVSRDNGTTYTQTPLTEDTVYDSQAFNQGGIDSYTKLMLHCDGSNGGTTFTDSSDSPHTVTPVGALHTDTAVKKFGTASAQFDGGSTNVDYLTIPDSTDWDFTASKATIDFWVNLTDLPPSGITPLIGQIVGGTNNWQIYIYSTGSIAVGINNVSEIQSATGLISTGTWYHIAVVKTTTANSAPFVIYLNGVSVKTGTGAYFNDSSTNLVIGGGSNQGGHFDTEGYMDEIRISKGIARYTADFTVPSYPYSAGDPAEAYTRRLVSGSVDISGQPSGTNMKYKVETLNQSASKVCRLHGASLLWA